MTARLLHFDGAAGISGDLCLGALIDLGVDLDRLRESLNALRVDGWSLEATRIDSSGIQATKVQVEVDGRPADSPPEEGEAHHGHGHSHDHEHGHEHGHEHSHAQPHRGWKEIRELIASAKLPERVKLRSLSIFRALCEAEAEVHGIPLDDVHLHEVGSVDAIIDIVGTCLALEQLGVDRISCSAPVLGGGMVRCAHGVLPVPAPATARLLQGREVRGGGPDFELTTPTGAAILVALSEHWGTLPSMSLGSSGFGAGNHVLPDRPNVLRATLGERAERAAGLVLIEADVDDASPELLAAACERLREAGARDVTQAAVVMKKGRVGQRLGVLCDLELRDRLVDLLFEETPTIGCRWHAVERAECEREMVEAQTEHGPVKVKVSSWKGRVVSRKPEHDACLSLAKEKGLSLREVHAAALRALDQS
jgi:uncharacterized protein (TIGR00299 family) protein